MVFEDSLLWQGHMGRPNLDLFPEYEKMAALGKWHRWIGISEEALNREIERHAKYKTEDAKRRAPVCGNKNPDTGDSCELQLGHYPEGQHEKISLLDSYMRY